MSAVVDSLPLGRNVASRSTGPPVRYLAMLASVLLLMLTGVVVVLSASTWTAVTQTGDAFSLFTRHATYVAIAIFALLLSVGRDYRRWRRLAPTLLIVSTLSLLLVIFTGRTVNGSTRGLDLGPISFQPSEIMKIVVPLVMAWYLGSRPLPPRFKHLFWSTL